MSAVRVAYIDDTICRSVNIAFLLTAEDLKSDEQVLNQFRQIGDIRLILRITVNVTGQGRHNSRDSPAS